MQNGQLFKRNGAWHIRFYRDEIINGKAVRRRVSKKLAKVGDAYRSKQDVWPLVQREIEPVNSGAAPEGGLTFADFYENHYLPHIKAKRAASTFRFYRDTFRYYLKESVGTIRLRDFTTAHAQKLLDSIQLSHQTLLRIKTCMSAAFTIARQKDFIRTANPVVGSKAEGTRSKFEPHAYTLKEIAYMLSTLGEPARTAIGVAAFSGLREGEIRGLWWPDYTGVALYVKRAVWRTYVGESKTKASEGFVPVIKPLRTMLDQHKQNTGGGDGFIFAGIKKGKSLNLDNLTARVIRPVLGDKWKGWHAFRRGLSTNLFELGVPAEVAQVILRHADVSTTRKHYIILQNQRHGAAAMKTLERAMRKARFGQQMGNGKSGNKPR